MSLPAHQRRSALVKTAQFSNEPSPADGKSAFERDFSHYLISEKIVDNAVLGRAVGAARKSGERLDRVLTKLGLVSEEGLTVAFSKFLSIEIVQPKDIPLERIIPDVVEGDFVRRNRIFPLSLGDGVLTVG